MFHIDLHPKWLKDSRPFLWIDQAKTQFKELITELDQKNRPSTAVSLHLPEKDAADRNRQNLHIINKEDAIGWSTGRHDLKFMPARKTGFYFDARMIKGGLKTQTALLNQTLPRNSAYCVNLLTLWPAPPDQNQ